MTASKRPLRVLISSLVPLLALAMSPGALFGSPPPQPTAADRLATLPATAISARKSFVIAFEGESYLFNPSAGVMKAPFLPGVYKAFGFSYDSRYCLYLKSNGKLPSFALYSYDLLQKTERWVANGVHQAAWSPASLKLAYVALESGSRLRLWVHDLASGSTDEVFAGALNTEYLEWSPDGNQLRYVSLTASTETSFEDQTYDYQLREYDVYGGANSLIVQTALGQSTIQATGGADASGLRQALVSTGQGSFRNLAFGGAGIAYATAIENDALVVKKRDPASGVWAVLAPGQVFTATDDGVVLRRFHSGGVEYEYVSNAATATAQGLALTASYKLPFQGSAYLVQGGAAFNDGVCDGRRCLVIAHKNGLASALDWQQTPEDGQGNQHILAVAEGTVVSTANNVTCNNVNTACTVGYDDYLTPCPANDGAGNFVVIAHSDGSYSLYAHLKSGSVQVAANDQVTQGAYLADQGHSGSANSPTKYRKCGDHLHFQRQSGPGVFGQSVATDFGETPCALSCMTGFVSDNVEVGAPSAGALSVTLAPSTVIGSLTTVGNKVILPTAAPADGTTVNLSTTDAGRASVPATIGIPAGENSGSFSITINGDVSVATPVTISATQGGSAAVAELTVGPAAVAALTMAASPIGGGNSLTGNEVALNGIAGPNFTVALTSSKPAVVQVPQTVTIPAGATFAAFDLTTSNVSAATTVTIKASGGGVSKSATLTVKPFNLASLTLSPASVSGGASTSANKVKLSTAAPPGGAVVTLSSSDPAVAQTPASVTVPAGATASPAFAITTSAVGVTTPISITASLGTGIKSGTLTVNPVAVTSLTLSPATVVGGVPTTGNKVKLNAPAPPGGADVSLGSSDSSAANPPPAITVAAGSTTSATFKITTGWVAASAGVTITASYGGVSKNATLTVNPVVISSLTLSPASLSSGASTTGNKVLLNGPAPTGGAVVTLSSSDASLARVPASATVPAGAKASPTFKITAGSGSGQVTISASYGGNTKTATLTVR